MANPVEALAAGIQDSLGLRAIAKISTNNNVKTMTGAVGVVSDVVQFAGTSVTGNWMVPNQRTRIMGTPTIGTSSIGTSYSALPSPVGPIIVVQPDARVKML